MNADEAQRYDPREVQDKFRVFHNGTGSYEEYLQSQDVT